MTDVMKVLFPGAYTTIQDEGRVGYQAFGVPVSGSLDLFAHRVANELVGNAPHEATLELTVLGPKLEILRDCQIAITGGNLQPFIDQSPLPQWQTVTVTKGSVISFKGVKTGCRAYLAVRGGFDVPQVMGSRSTYARGGIGGIQGRPLKAGDILPSGSEGKAASRHLPDAFIPAYPRELTCHVIPGPQASFFRNLDTFYKSTYEITSKADRMGYRLKGPLLEFREGVPESIISEAIAPGSIQVPADGQPIILMVEQTVGGYAKVGVISTPDRWRLSQLRPGDKVRFEPIDIESAHALYRGAMARFREIHEVLTT